ncbi:exported protein of unknown function [Nitrosotalea devaniterrae]|uniref:Uncharacterized protein n=1 Tax=Nitrosotalea devaniterrae TaxID=1078905 RepID=A0A128A1D3_9ARCH|nr:exported protein of unknown function [Candidatus Nitrosotalea devanaterra]
MKALADKTKSMIALFGISLIVVFTIAPHAFALTTADDPHGPLESIAWTAAMAVAGVMSGIGIVTTIKRGKPHQK